MRYVIVIVSIALFIVWDGLYNRGEYIEQGVTDAQPRLSLGRPLTLPHSSSTNTSSRFSAGRNTTTGTQSAASSSSACRSEPLWASAPYFASMKSRTAFV